MRAVAVIITTSEKRILSNSIIAHITMIAKIPNAITFANHPLPFTYQVKKAKVGKSSAKILQPHINAAE